MEKKLSSITFPEGSSADNNILVKHLQEELRHYEAEVREARKLKSSHENIELLKEKLLEEKGRRDRAEAELLKLADIQLTVKKLEDELSTWKSMVLEIPGVSCADDIPRKFASLQKEVLDSMIKMGEAQASLKQMEVALDNAKLDKSNTEAEVNLAKEKAEILKSELKRTELMVGSSNPNRFPPNNHLLLGGQLGTKSEGDDADGLASVSEERDRLKHIVEEPRTQKSVDAGIEVSGGKVVQELELSLAKKENFIKELESSLSEQKEVNGRQLNELKLLNDRLSSEARRIKSLEREGDRLRSEVALLESKLGHGDYSSTNTKVLRMVNTLGVDNETKQTIEALQNELQKTKEKLQAVEELKKQSADAGTLVDSYISGKILQLKEQVATLEKREERYKTVFADRISVFRRACCELFGYKIVMDDHQRADGIPVTRFTLQSIYAQSDDEKLEFEYESGNTNILVEIFVRKMNSIPAFTANLTVVLADMQFLMTSNPPYPTLSSILLLRLVYLCGRQGGLNFSLRGIEDRAMDMEIGQDFKGEVEDSNCPDEQEVVMEETTLDWRGRPSNPAKHGGIRAALFVLGLQGFEIMGLAAVGNNLITYVINEMHFSLSKSANIVTNFIGTVFLLALLGGYLSDSFLGCFWTALIFAFLELSGFILLSIQAHIPQLKPPKCNMLVDGEGCEEAKGLKALVFFIALYLVAIGSGCVKPNMIAHGANQFDPNQNPKKLSTYFNAAYFAFSVGELVALTLLVWVQTHSGMDVGFGISAAAMAMGLISLVCGTVLYRNKPPQGSIFTPISQVFVAAFRKRKTEFPSDPRMLHGSRPTLSYHLHHTNRFRFLDEACIKQVEDGALSSKENPWRLCTVTQVEQVKVLLSMIPIFACTIIFNTILAQLQTFSVQQGSAMNTNLKSFKIPPASLQAIPYMMLIFILPLYDAVFVPFARNLTAHPSGISPLLRIGLGLFTATFSMVSAALTEHKRKTAAEKSGEILSIFWIAPQFLIFGFSEMLTAVGLIEFFYKESTKGMQTFATSMTYCSYSFGFYLSSVLVSMVNKITSSDERKGWLSDNNLNNDRLDLFYWLLAGLSFLNFLNYVFWARWFSRNRSPEQRSFGTTKVVGDNDDSISVA
nr:protein NRT1/ PTR FAMILY 4.3-like [Ipomoea batatas]